LPQPLRLLAIESSQSRLSIAARAGDAVFEDFVSNGKLHAEKIIPLADGVLRSVGLSLAELDAVAVSQGPGSFTSLRIGFSTAKGFCFAHDLPLITVPTLFAIVQAEAPHLEADVLIPVVFSKANEYYFAAYDQNLALIAEAAYGTDAGIVQFAQARQGRVIFIGERLASLKQLMPEGAFTDASHFSARHILKLAQEKFERKEFTDISEAEPFYLKSFEAKKSLKKFFGLS
jgi:tRNA threonylcarbamoyladenosine biosynthesis protein TsaB